MAFMRLISVSQLADWVRGNERRAQEVIPELVYWLVSASSPEPHERRFLLEDNINQPGPDGFLVTDFAYPPYVPEGTSYWEVGAGKEPRKKATEDYKDYKDLKKSVSEEEMAGATFIFVTPSSRNSWDHASQKKWIEKRVKDKLWADIKIIDGQELNHWLDDFPAIQYWLADQMGQEVLKDVSTPLLQWDELQTIGHPLLLKPSLFLGNRDEACEQLHKALTGDLIQLKLETRYPKQAKIFVSAYLASLDKDDGIDFASRCLVVSNPEAWKSVSSLKKNHILIADFNLSNTGAVKIRQKTPLGQCFCCNAKQKFVTNY